MSHIVKAPVPIAHAFDFSALPAEIRIKLMPSVEGCWVWSGSTRNGYGKVSFRRATRSAHRVAYESIVGAIPEGLTLDHLCRNKKCCAAHHLDPVTTRINTLRGVSRSARFALLQSCPKCGGPFSSEERMKRTKLTLRRFCAPCRIRKEADRRERTREYRRSYSKAYNHKNKHMAKPGYVSTAPRRKKFGPNETPLPQPTPYPNFTQEIVNAQG